MSFVAGYLDLCKARYIYRHEMWMNDKNLSNTIKTKFNGSCYVCSPDKTETCSISNPKVNRILNKIAIRAISSFLSLIFTIIFLCTFVYTLLFFLPLFCEQYEVWIFIDLDKFTTIEASERISFFGKTPISCGFHLVSAQVAELRSFTRILCMFWNFSFSFCVDAFTENNFFPFTLSSLTDVCERKTATEPNWTNQQRTSFRPKLSFSNLSTFNKY